MGGDGHLPSGELPGRLLKIMAVLQNNTLINYSVLDVSSYVSQEIVPFLYFVRFLNGYMSYGNGTFGP